MQLCQSILEALWVILCTYERRGGLHSRTWIYILLNLRLFHFYFSIILSLHISWSAPHCDPISSELTEWGKKAFWSQRANNKSTFVLVNSIVPPLPCYWSIALSTKTPYRYNAFSFLFNDKVIKTPWQSFYLWWILICFHFKFCL